MNVIKLYFLLFCSWGIHNCQPEEAVGVVCKTAVDSCQEGYWNCEDGLKCIPIAYICDEVDDCYDKSDESDKHCNVRDVFTFLFVEFLPTVGRPV